MIFWTIVQVAFQSLGANKLRSVLAMLGIIIGVWSVISSLALAAGAQKKIVDQFATLGTNVLIVVPGQVNAAGVTAGPEKNLTIGDAYALVSLREIARVAPIARGQAQAKHGNKNAPTNIIGTSPTYFPIRNFRVQKGRIFSDAECDDASRVALLGAATAKSLFGDGIDAAVGESISLNGVPYHVIGVLQSKGNEGWFNDDDLAIIPYTTAMQQVLGVSALSDIDIGARDDVHLTVTQDRIAHLLRKRHRLAAGAKDDFTIYNMADDLNKTAANINMVLTLLLGGIAGISLLVGGIGVMNVMLVSVTERTREIGIRKAIGAKRSDILTQFIIEAVIMSASGGFIGVLLGMVTALAVSALQSHIELVVTLQSVVLALGFSATIGIFFGYYPAYRAARLDPIEALRHE